MKKKALIVVDMQNDFIDGSLGNEHAAAIVEKVCQKIKDWDGDIYYTMDTHKPDTYAKTTEGKNLPVDHCMAGTHGWDMNGRVYAALWDKVESIDYMCHHAFGKECFGSVELAVRVASEHQYVELTGLCTDVCVISNAVMIRNQNPYMQVVVDASCCAGVTPENHRTALEAMKCCGIQVINDE